MKRDTRHESGEVEETKTAERLLETTPRVDLHESDQGIRLWADLPGGRREARDLRLADRTLSIEGRVAVSEAGESDSQLRARKFVRRFAVPHDIQADKVQATLANGVLELYLPKGPGSRPRSIEVKAG